MMLGSFSCLLWKRLRSRSQNSGSDSDAASSFKLRGRCPWHSPHGSHRTPSVPDGCTHRHDPEPDMVVTPLRFKSQAKGRAAGPALVGPATAPAHPGDAAVFAFRGRVFRIPQVRIDAAGQLRTVPVPAPLEGVAMHVVQTPRSRGIAADLGRLPERRARLGAVVGLPLEVRLFAA